MTKLFRHPRTYFVFVWGAPAVVGIIGAILAVRGLVDAQLDTLAGGTTFLFAASLLSWPLRVIPSEVLIANDSLEVKFFTGRQWTINIDSSTSIQRMMLGRLGGELRALRVDVSSAHRGFVVTESLENFDEFAEALVDLSGTSLVDANLNRWERFIRGGGSGWKSSNV